MADLATRYKEQTAGLQKGNTGRTGGFAAPLQSKVSTGTKFIKPGGLPGAIQKTVDVGKQTFNVAKTIAGAGARFVGNTAVDVGKAALLAGKTYVDYQTQPIQNRIIEDASRQLDRKEQEIVSAYKSGKMSPENYSKARRDLAAAYQSLSNESRKISSGPTPQQRAFAITETAVNVLTVGRFTALKTTVKPVSLVAKSVKGLDDLVTKVPAVRGLVERNAKAVVKREAQKLAGESTEQYIKREGTNIAVGLLIKRPLFYQTNVGGANEVYKKILDGDYDGATKSSAWLASQMINGGPIGGFFKLAGAAKNKLSLLSYGRGSYIDEISKRIGNGSPAQISRFLTTMQKKAPNEFNEAEKTFRILQETNLRAANDSVEQAVDNTINHYVQHNVDLSTVTPSQLYKDMQKWAQADELAQKTLRSGLVADVAIGDAGKYVVVRWDSTTKRGVAETIEKAGESPIARLDALEEMANRPGVGWGNNAILMNKLRDAVVNSPTARDAAKAINQISTASTILKGIPKKVAEQLADLGYSIAAPFGGRRTPIVDFDDTRKLVTGAIKGDTAIFDIATAPQPDLAGLASGLAKIGLSPRSANKVANEKLTQSLVANIDELGLGTTLGLRDSQGGDVVNGGRAILSKLQQYIENKKPAFSLGRSAAITDVRQLRVGEIQEALKVTPQQAKALQGAMLDAYTKVPLEFRGLGDRVVDVLFKYNPLQKHYSRIQAALRYTYNPFFRVQERVETGLLSRTKGHNLIWMRSREELNEAAKTLDDAGIFNSSLPGEAAQDQVFGRITANITQGQKRDLAGLALKMSQARGVTLQQMVNEHADEVDDALRVIVQYPNKGIISSPLARTLNVAFFPMRYNAKVTALVAQEIAKAPPSVQLATINGLFEMRGWLKSDEGIAWQSHHADAIQVLKWVSPVNSLEYTMKILTGNINAPGELGLLGGLPLGFISQMLDSQGIINLNVPYVNPKTGEEIPDYIPVTTKAKAAVAVTELLGTMFTFPGRILGLPGKEATLRKVVDAFIDTNGKDFDKQMDTENLTDLQKNWIRVLKGDTSPESIDALYMSPASGSYRGYTIPPLELPVIVRPTTAQKPLERRTGLPSGKRARGSREKNRPLPIPSR